VPLIDTIQPAGQSVCLQAMACGRAVILSDIMGLWDSELMRHHKNIWLVRPRSKIALQNALRQLTNDTKLCADIGNEGRKLVERHFNAELMAAALTRLFSENNFCKRAKLHS